jgi:hypothetical protein
VSTSWPSVALVAVGLAALLANDYLDKLPAASRSPSVLRCTTVVLVAVPGGVEARCAGSPR